MFLCSVLELHNPKLEVFILVIKGASADQDPKLAIHAANIGRFMMNQMKFCKWVALSLEIPCIKKKIEGAGQNVFCCHNTTAAAGDLSICSVKREWGLIKQKKALY